jgi:hypothetical protein
MSFRTRTPDLAAQIRELRQEKTELEKNNKELLSSHSDIHTLNADLKILEQYVNRSLFEFKTKLDSIANQMEKIESLTQRIKDLETKSLKSDFQSKTENNINTLLYFADKHKARLEALEALLDSRRSL